ncbi:MAG: PHP domain-containing protein [Lachnospiraceae bacterium]|nr:PHP domain-containing protein [Lachnospiraceae bacterium]
MHSRYSDDGEFTPTELVEQCAKAGVRMVSVTDHNCAKANEEAQRAAKEKGIRYISGIEIDCTYENVNFHVLGYGIDFWSSDFKAIEKNVADQSAQASLERLERTQALGFSRISEKDMLAMEEGNYWQRNWTGEMFAEALLAMPEYADHPLLAPYRPGGGRSDNPYVNFYWDYYSQGKLCYAKTNYPIMGEIIETIHRNHGAAVLAHPGVNLKGKEIMLEDILRLGLDGIEAFSSYHSPEQAQAFYKTAREHRVLVTCGSDYHGKTKPSISLGQHGCTVPEEEMLDRICL